MRTVGPGSTRRLRLGFAGVAVLAAAAVGAGCGAGSSDISNQALGALGAPASSSTTTTTAAPASNCTDALASYPATPPAASTEVLRADPALRAVVDRGRLVVAVDENTEGLASRNSAGELVGLEIDLAREIARSIFGDPAPVQFLTVTTSQKIEYPATQHADLSISAISMTCARWQKVAFSTEYFTAAHAFLVRDNSPIRAAADVAGKRVCMTKGSTSIKTLENLRIQPAPIEHLVDARTDCLVALQEGVADAYFGHDTFLVGMIEQDPALRIVPQGDAQHYGIAMGPKDTGLVQHVNGVLDRMRADGTLAALSERWLGPLYRNAHQPLPAVPAPDTSRPLA